jgi:DNA topoisomerase-3
MEYLPMIPGEYRYGKKEATGQQADIVKGFIKSHLDKDILIATDAGREGEVIARIVLQESGLKDLSRCRRFWVSEALTPEVIRTGIMAAKPLQTYNAIAAQGFARQHADWLVGMNLSRYITLGSESGEKFSAGRVQSSVLAAVLDRNTKARTFVPTVYNELELVLTDSSGVNLKAWLENPETGKTPFAPKSSYVLKAMEYAKTHGKNSDLSITVETVTKSRKPEKLMNITALQKAAYSSYGYSPDETLALAQGLYEKHKCLSYPRTPSRVMGDNNVQLFRDTFEKLKGLYPDYSKYCLPELITGTNKHIFNSEALEDHHALIPLAALPSGAPEKEKNVFEIVVRSFFGVCMKNYIWNECNYSIRNGTYNYGSVTKEVVETGWRKLYAEEKEDKEDVQFIKQFDLNSCSVTGIKILDKKTTPPKNYQIDSLLAFMEHPQAQAVEETKGVKLAGLGTPATRAEIIKILFDKGYIAEEKKHLVATTKGAWLVQRLRSDSLLGSITNVAETTKWEKQLEENPAGFELLIVDYIKKCIKPVKPGEAVYEREAVGVCPVCGSKMYEGKKSYYCSAWNRESNPCKFAIWKKIAGAAVSLSDAKLLLGKKKTPVKNCLNKEGKKFKASFSMDQYGKVAFHFSNTKKKK